MEGGREGGRCGKFKTKSESIYVNNKQINVSQYSYSNYSQLHYSPPSLPISLPPTCAYPRMKKIHPLSTKLASLGIMGDKLSANLEPYNTIECYDGPRALRVAPN